MICRVNRSAWYGLPAWNARMAYWRSVSICCRRASEASISSLLAVHRLHVHSNPHCFRFFLRSSDGWPSVTS